MTPEITIAPLSPADVSMAADAHAAWMVEAFRGSLPPEVVAAMTPERSLKKLSGAGRTLAAFRGEQLIALGQWEGPEITLLYTHPGARGTGIGAALFQKLLSEISAAGYPRAELVVLAANTGARRFYERQGGRILKPDNVHMAGHDLPHYRYVFDLEGKSPH